MMDNQSQGADPRELESRMDETSYTEHSLIGSSTPSGSLATAVEDLARRGYTEEFIVDGGRLRARETGRTFEPEELVIREHHRFEGTSDPDDMSIVYAIESPSGDRGTLVDAFGVYADPAVSAVVRRIPTRLARAG
jgi:hypothetical protein